MITMPLSQAADIVGGRLAGEDGVFRGLCHDTRTLRPGQLFVALHGERTDGHRFVDHAIASGAAGTLVEGEAKAEPAIIVEDSLTALGALAAGWRQKFDLPLIAITGSNGKTTVRSMTASILQQQFDCLSTHGNFNNEIGLPLSLSMLNADHQRAVIEMGAGRPGDIAYLCRIARPLICLINNASAAHLEGMGSVRQIAETKGELVANLSVDGIAVLNVDDDHFGLWKAMSTGAKVVTFGLEDNADVALLARTANADGSQSISIRTPFWKGDLRLHCLGVHNAVNALAATAAALAAGATKESVVAGLEAFRPVDARLQRRQLEAGWTLIEDSYNANPASVEAGVDVLCEQSSPTVLVLGDMAELGPDAEALHFQVGARAKRAGVDHLLGVGPLSRHAVQAFGENGRHFASKDELVAALLDIMESGGTCLVKGSRSARMEDVGQKLEARGCY